jgi:hypothetical protein
MLATRIPTDQLDLLELPLGPFVPFVRCVSRFSGLLRSCSTGMYPRQRHVVRALILVFLFLLAAEVAGVRQRIVPPLVVFVVIIAAALCTSYTGRAGSTRRFCGGHGIARRGLLV